MENIRKLVRLVAVTNNHSILLDTTLNSNEKFGQHHAKVSDV